MKFLISIAEIIFFSFSIILICNIIACTKTTKETLKEEEKEIKALDDANIKPIFIEEAEFYETTNKTRQITEVPKEEEKEEKEELIEFTDTYDPFAIVYANPNGGVFSDWNIYYTFSYQKKDWVEIVDDRLYSDDIESIVYHPKQKRWGGKIPKWFKVDINVRGLGGDEETYYINTFKQKRTAYFFVTGTWLANDDIIAANIARGWCGDTADRVAEQIGCTELKKKNKEEISKKKKDDTLKKKKADEERKKKAENERNKKEKEETRRQEEYKNLTDEEIEIKKKEYKEIDKKEEEEKKKKSEEERKQEEEKERKRKEDEKNNSGLPDACTYDDTYNDPFKDIFDDILDNKKEEKNTETEDDKSKNEEPSEAEKYGINEENWDKCLKIERGMNVYDAPGHNKRAKPGKKGKNPIGDHKEPKHSRLDYNI